MIVLVFMALLLFELALALMLLLLFRLLLLLLLLLLLFDMTLLVNRTVARAKLMNVKALTPFEVGEQSSSSLPTVGCCWGSINLYLFVFPFITLL